MSGRKLQILLVDDHAVVRGGLRLLLAQSGDMEVAGEAESAERRTPNAEVERGR